MRVLCITNHPIEDASCRYRIFEYLPHLRRLGFDVEVHPFTDPGLYARIHQTGHPFSKLARFGWCTFRRLARLPHIRNADVTLLHREAFPFGPPLLEAFITRYSRASIFSFDDALYAPYPYATGARRRLLYRLKYGRNLARVLSSSSAVIAGNEILAQYARRHNQRVHVIPTAIDTDRYTLRSSRDGNSGVTIGWIGSPSTSVYLKGIEGALIDVASRSKARVRFTFIGDPSLKMDLPNLEVRPWRLNTELSDLQSFDIGLMPIDDSEWSRGKCAFKAVQYMAVGTPVIASPVGAACEVVRDGQTGFLASDTAEWKESMRTLIDDEGLRRHMGLNGRAVVVHNFSIESTLPDLIDVLYQARDASRTASSRP